MKISIIIPVFNAEKFLRQCVASVIGQAYRDLEIILVDDGSTDESPKICDEFAAEDSRIIAVHQANGGVSVARNIGLEKATGDWITFIDADDYIQENYFRIIHVDTKTDWIHLNMERDNYYKGYESVNFENQEYTVQEFVAKYSLYPHFPEAWAKFFKRDIIERNNLRFNNNLKFGEDSLFNLSYLKFCNKISTTDISRYVYKNGEGGLSKLTYDVINDSNLFLEIEKELSQYQYPDAFCNKTIKIPLMRYLRILYYNPEISSIERRILLKKI